MTNNHFQLTKALKEWAVAVDAIAAGETITLLRKGGIRETQGRFVPEARSVLLFPTYEHQKPALLKARYQAQVSEVNSGWHPEKITLKAWAEVTHVFATQQPEQVAALNSFHIWQPQLAAERLKWKPGQPLYVLLLRAYRLEKPIELSWIEAYGGCRSWLTLPEAIDVDTARPAIALADYDAQTRVIAACLS